MSDCISHLVYIFKVLGLLADCSRFSKSRYVQRFGLPETEEFLWECFHYEGQEKFYCCPLQNWISWIYTWWESKLTKKSNYLNNE